MFQSDIVGVAVVYIYVAVLIVFTEKVISKKYPVQSRKFLHIMTGNIAFILPLFATREVMAFIAAGPFILFTFLIRRLNRCRGRPLRQDMGWVWCTMR
jgi:phytol kinase